MSLRNIVVPTDLSTPAASALRAAAQIARRAGADLTLAHMDPGFDLSLAAPEPAYLPPALMEALRRTRIDHVEHALNELASELPDDISRSVIVRSGEVVPGILDLAQSLRSDLIVIGSRGRGATRFIVGSVAAKVARSAPCPVLVVHAYERESDERSVGEFRRALVAVDYSPFSRVAAHFAAQLVGADGQLELLHVWNDRFQPEEWFSDAAALSAWTEAARSNHATALDDFAAGLDVACRVTTYLASGSVPRSILERRQASGADLVVVGAHAREHLAQRILGTTADTVLRHADCPVLVIPDTALAPTDDRRDASEASTP
jgi:nucleotide-binding universal stress UspA family protein